MARGRSVVRRTVRTGRMTEQQSRILAAEAGARVGRGMTSAERTVVGEARRALRLRAASASRSAARAAVGSASKGPTSGQYSSAIVQQTKSSSSARMGRKTTAAQTALKLTRSQLETVIYRWNGVKAFDTNGYYWMTNRVSTLTGRRDMPFYLFDLTSVTQNPNLNYCNPMLQLGLDTVTANAAFFPVVHQAANGGALGSGGTVWTVEKMPIATADTQPLSKSMLKSLSIKLNCWGAKTKAAAYTIQLVKFLDDELVPSHTSYAVDAALATTKRTDFYQNQIKSLTYNPIAQTGGSYKGRMKVLKSETFIIQPNDAGDQDTDPNVRTVSMYVAMNRIISYQESATQVFGDTNVADDSDYGIQTVTQFKPQTRPKSRVYLLIKCSNYKVDTADSNVDTPSFDLMVRANHQVTK